MGTVSQKIRVLVADDDPVVRVAIRVMLETTGFDVVGEAADGRQAVDRTAELVPDVVLMDMMMPVMDGARASRKILQRRTSETPLRRRTSETPLRRRTSETPLRKGTSETSPARHRGVRIVALTSLEADQRVLAAIRAGVQGYVHKSAAREELAEAVRTVHRGELVLPAALTRKFLVGAEPLTGVESTLRTLQQDWPTLRTKLYRPPVPEDFVVREELLARLEAGLRLPLTLVSAPAGYGKTCLLSHWLETRSAATRSAATRSAATRSAATTGAPSAWLSLEAADSDLPILILRRRRPHSLPHRL